MVGRESGYDAFISYSQAVSGKLAAVLQGWLERFATPWYRPRSLRIFRDYTSLAANDDLSKGLRDALAQSRHFVLLASPEAAASRWVDEEVAWWRQHRSSEKFFIVLTDGRLTWDDESADWDWTRTDALPPSTHGLFAREPLWVDLSSLRSRQDLDRSNPLLLNSVAQIAAPLRGVDKDMLVGEHITLHRRARRQRHGGFAALAFLLVCTLLAAFLANEQRQAAEEQRDAARRQRDIALSRLLAVRSQAVKGTAPQTAVRLLMTAHRLDPDQETSTALANLILETPWAGTIEAHRAPVNAVAVANDGTTVVSLADDRTITRWNTATYAAPVRLALPDSDDRDTVSMALSPHATVAATVDGRFRMDADYRTVAQGMTSVDVWDVTGGREPRKLTAIPITKRDGFPPALVISEDGGRLVMAEGEDVSVWDIPPAGRPKPRGRMRRPGVSGDDAGTYSMAFSKDGRKLALLFPGVSLGLWDVSRTTPRLLDSINTVPFMAPVRFAPDGKELTTGGEGQSGMVIRVEVSGGQRLRWLGDAAEIVPGGSVAFSPDSRSIAVGSESGNLRTWAVDGAGVRKVGTELTAGDSAITASTYLPDGRSVATAAEDGTVTLWHVQGGTARPARMPTPPTDGRILLSPDWRALATSTDGTTTLWDMNLIDRPRRLAPPMAGDPVLFLPGERILTDTAGEYDDPEILLWDYTDEKRPRSLTTKLSGEPARVSAAGHVLTNAFGDPESTARVWEVPADGRSPTLVTSLPGNAAVLSDRFFMTSDKENLLWDLTGPGKPSHATLPPQVHHFLEDTDERQRLSPDGRTVVLNGKSATSPATLLDISDPAKPVEAGALEGSSGQETLPMAFSPDSKILATVATDGGMALWDVSDPRAPTRLSTPISARNSWEEPSSIIVELEFSRDGKTLLIGDSNGGSDDGFTLWEVTDPRRPNRLVTAPLRGEGDSSSTTRFSPDGNTVVTGTSLWNIAALNRLRARPVEQACALAGRGLTEAEWAVYAPGIGYQDTCAGR